jgi:hypothetical protein
MNNTNTGGPAFPRAPFTYTDNNNGLDWAVREQSGMTLRDYFAAKAMVFYFAGPDAKVISKQPDAIARWCYIMADEMLKAREA